VSDESEAVALAREIANYRSPLDIYPEDDMVVPMTQARALARAVLEHHAELEVRKEALSSECKAHRDTMAERDRLRAEIEKLRGELIGVGMAASNTITKMHYEREDLKAERDRLILSRDEALHELNDIRHEMLKRDSHLEIDDYEVVNLLWLLRIARRLGLDTGDWLGQLIFKLEARPCSMRDPNSPPSDTEERLNAAAKRILGKP